MFGEVWVDDYQWIRNDSDPDVLTYLDAENKVIFNIEMHYHNLIGIYFGNFLMLFSMQTRL
jgi:protease II